MELNSVVKTPVIEGGKRLSNKAMLSSGFKLQYPDFKVGYQALLLDAASSLV
jgi:hypothetical protein